MLLLRSPRKSKIWSTLHCSIQYVYNNTTLPTKLKLAVSGSFWLIDFSLSQSFVARGRRKITSALSCAFHLAVIHALLLLFFARNCCWRSHFAKYLTVLAVLDIFLGDCCEYYKLFVI